MAIRAEGIQVPGWKGWTKAEFRKEIWRRIKVGTPEECWIWTAGAARSGYGKIKWRGRTYRAHRVVYELSVGPLVSGQLVLHRCDVRRCCNPSHLYLGTMSDNTTDSSRRGRHHNAKLTEEQVREIRERRARGERGKDIAKDYPVTMDVIYKIGRREAYAWVT